MIFALALFLGCNKDDDSSGFVSITAAGTSDTILVTRENSAEGNWGSSSFRCNLDCSPGIYSSNITTEILGLDGNPIPYDYITASVVDYQGEQTSINLTIAVHADSSATPNLYTLIITGQNQKAKGTLSVPIRLL